MGRLSLDEKLIDRKAMRFRKKTEIDAQLDDGKLIQSFL